MNEKRLANKVLKVLSHIIEIELHYSRTVTFNGEIDCTNIERIRNQYKLENKKSPSYTSFIIKAIADATKEHPYVNARIFSGWFGKYLHHFKKIDILVACEKELANTKYFAFTDIIRDIDQKPLEQINYELTQLAKCNESNNEQLKSFLQVIRKAPTFLAKFLCTLPTRSPKLWEKYRGSAFLISSPAKYGVDGVNATWPSPINFSFGLVQKKPMVKDGEIQAVTSFTFVMNFDRRVIAGAPAAKFFRTITENLKAPHLKEQVSVCEQAVSLVS